MKRICVIGSLNVDLTITVPRFHAPGETILGTSFHTFTGGKGGNQAIALGRLGADVTMVGMLGRDGNGALYRETLAREGVQDRFVAACDSPTGVALIEVCDQDGDNRIAILMGANGMVDIPYIDSIWPALSGYDIFLMQLENPMDTVLHAARLISDAGKTLILDPAPAQPLPDALIACATYITPNETELAILTGIETGDKDKALAAAKSLITRGAKRVIAKLGADGAMLVTADGAHHVPGFPVKAVDTTAAGDSFNAGLAFALSEGRDILAAIRFANAVGGLATTQMGAQAAMPSRAAAEKLIHDNP